MDTQDKRPAFEKGLGKVGIENLRTLVKLNHGDSEYRFIPRIRVSINLKRDRRGIHMSRLIEAIAAVVEEETLERHESFEELCRSILDKIRSRHDYESAEVEMATELAVDRTTPVSRKKSREVNDIRIVVKRDGERYSKTLEVVVLGNTVCPHAMKHGGKPHIQRAVATLRIETEFKNRILLEDMIEVVESCFPSPVYTLLKTEDEMDVVNKMYERPKFVEDLTRDIIRAASERFRSCGIYVKSVAEESIHRHDAFAEDFFEN